MNNKQDQGYAKGTWVPTHSDTISFTFLNDPTDISGRRDRNLTNARDRSRVQGGNNYAGNYSRIHGNVLIEGAYNLHNGEVSDFSAIRQPANTVIYRATDTRTLADEQLGGFGQDIDRPARHAGRARQRGLDRWTPHVQGRPRVVAQRATSANTTTIDSATNFVVPERAGAASPATELAAGVLQRPRLQSDHDRTTSPGSSTPSTRCPTARSSTRSTTWTATARSPPANCSRG